MSSPHSFADFASARRFVSLQIAAWRLGVPPEAVQLLANHPGLLRHRSLVLDLAFEEYCLRVERGGRIRPSEFSRRFPALRRSLERLLLLHDELGSWWGEPRGAGEVEWPEPGGRWLDFELLEILGRGLTSRVYLARHAVWGTRAVVLKLTPRGTREADVAGQLVHPRIVPVLSFHDDNRTGWSGVCMPFLGRRTLEDLLDQFDADTSLAPRSERFFELAAAERGTAEGDERGIELALGEGRFPGRDHEEAIPWGAVVAWIGREIADALAWLHGRGRLHGDLKPANLLIAPDGSPRLLDFHLSKPLGSELETIGGTLPYLAPELIAAAAGRSSRPRADGRTDLFALGMVLYELATGHLPHEADEARDSDARSRRESPAAEPTRGRLIETVGVELASTIVACLAPEVERRVASAAELRRRLDAALRKLLPPPPRVRSRRRWPAWIAAWGLVGCGGTWWMGAGVDPPVPAASPAAHEGRERRRDDELAAAWQAWNEERWAEARSAFAAGIAQYPTEPEWYLGRGLARRRLAQGTVDRQALRLAGEDFARCRDLGGPPYACAAFAEVLHAAHDEQGALRWYSEAVRRGFESAELRCNLAAIALNRGDPGTTLIEAGRALELAPRLVAAQRLEARARLVAAPSAAHPTRRLTRLDSPQLIPDRLANIRPRSGDLSTWPSDEPSEAPFGPLLIPYRDARSAHPRP